MAEEAKTRFRVTRNRLIALGCVLGALVLIVLLRPNVALELAKLVVGQ